MIKTLPMTLVCVLLIQCSSFAEQIPVRHREGVTLGFLVLKDLSGKTLAYGELKQVVKEQGLVVDDLQFHFKDGSYFREITKFTQDREFRMVSDQVVQKGPSFKRESESFIDAASGKVTFRTIDEGKEKVTTEHVDIPQDAANGLFMTLTKNFDPSAALTTVSMVAASDKPRVVKINITPGPDKPFKVGLIEHRAQHWVLKTKIEGAAGVVAPLMGKQPPDIHIWTVKSEAPAFLEFEGPLSQEGPVWRIEGTVPQPDSRKVQLQ
jgi:hypothetical protein